MEKEPVEIAESEIVHEEVSSGFELKREKFVALYKARSVLLAIGTVAEKMSAAKALKRMKKLGIESL